MKVQEENPYGYGITQKKTPVTITFKVGQELSGTCKLAHNTVYIDNPAIQIFPPIDLTVLPDNASLELDYNDIKQFIKRGGKSKKKSKARKRKFNNPRKYRKKR